MKTLFQEVIHLTNQSSMRASNKRKKYLLKLMKDVLQSINNRRNNECLIQDVFQFGLVEHVHVQPYQDNSMSYLSFG